MSFPATLLFGIIGIVNDRPRTLAIITTIIAGGLALLYMSILGFALLCR